MKKAFILFSSALFMVALAAAPGCSGGGDDDDDDDDDGTLASGTYGVTGTTVDDGCGFYGPDSYYDGVTEADVVATATTVDVTGFPDDLSFDVTGSTLTDNQFGGVSALVFSDNTSADYPLASGNEYACVAEFEIAYGGTITGASAFTLTDAYSLTVTSGAGCSLAVVNSAFTTPFTTAPPCSSVDEVDLSI